MKLLQQRWQSDVRAERLLQNFLFLAIQKGDNPFNSVKLFQCCFSAQSEKGLSPPCTSSEQAAHDEEKNKGNYDCKGGGKSWAERRRSLNYFQHERARTHRECLSSLLSAILFSFQYDKSSSLSSAIPLYMLAWRVFPQCTFANWI